MVTAQLVPVTVPHRCNSNPQFTPKNLAQSKTRFPLRFFPNQLLARVTQKFGIGLTICLKENGVRRVSRDLKERDQSREQWVPRVSISNKAGESIRLVHPERV